MNVYNKTAKYMLPFIWYNICQAICSALVQLLVYLYNGKWQTYTIVSV